MNQTAQLMNLKKKETQNLLEERKEEPSMADGSDCIVCRVDSFRRIIAQRVSKSGARIDRAHGREGEEGGYQHTHTHAHTK